MEYLAIVEAINRNTVRIDVLPELLHMIFGYTSNMMQRYTVYLSLESALHVSGGISTHNKDRTQLYLKHLVLVKQLLLPGAILELDGTEFRLFHDYDR